MRWLPQVRLRGAGGWRIVKVEARHLELLPPRPPPPPAGGVWVNLTMPLLAALQAENWEAASTQLRLPRDHPRAPDLEARTADGGDTALTLMAGAGRLALVRALLDAGARVDARAGRRETASLALAAGGRARACRSACAARKSAACSSAAVRSSM